MKGMFLRGLNDLVSPITDINTASLFYLITCLGDIIGNIYRKSANISSASELEWLWNQVPQFKFHLQCSLTVWLWAGFLPSLEQLSLLENKDEMNSCLPGLLWGLNKVIHIEWSLWLPGPWRAFNKHQLSLLLIP